MPARGRKAGTRVSRGPCSQPAGQANLTSLGYGAEQPGDSVGCLARLGTRTYLPCGSTEAERLPDGCQSRRPYLPGRAGLSSWVRMETHR